VGSLDPNDETLHWYARAVTAMKQKPIADPTSWRYQAAIHEYDSARDPLASAEDVLPGSAEQSKFWNQCQHGSWYFLPWHRMYLHHFEAIVAAQVKALGGPDDWALPYWDYSVSDDARLLPEAFRRPVLEDGTPNGLYVEERDPRADAGEPFAEARDTDVKAALGQPRFSAPSPGGSTSFGGPATSFEHSGGAAGALELTPHGSMHVAVGGDTGWMSAFNTAALDPIFWLHHANIDRLWQVWLDAGRGNHADPTSGDWLRSVSFAFHDAQGNEVTMVPADVLDTRKAPLEYTYDRVVAPLAPVERAAITEAIAMGEQLPPEMVGATERPIQLSEEATHATFAVASPSRGIVRGPTRAGLVDAARIFLNVEHLTSTRRVAAYDVYIAVPVGADPSHHEDKFVGRLPMFGLVEASRTGGAHSGSGLHYVLEVTEAIKRLAAQPGWDPSQLRVSFVPVRRVAGAKVDVGRVSLYVE
jgi:tyrosinase